jgi:alkanesulfonate monooxygenase SsuD/methylene tetrahydromethanopterin reductase-like flavin-dependent oxidoreductase (luciferase family)
VRFAVGIPNLGEYADPNLLVELAREAEAAGWDGFFVWDHLVHRDQAPVVDAWSVMSAVATATQRLRFGVLVLAMARRRPSRLAREAAAIDLLSGGRLVFGAGLGSLPEEEFTAFGEDADARVRAAKLDEGLEVVTGLWRGEPFSYQGRHHQVAETRFTPTPAQSPRPPVWVAGCWPARRPFRRAARWDGVFPTHRDVGHTDLFPPAELAEVVAYTLAHRQGGGPFDVVVEGVTPGDPAAAARVVAPYAGVGLTWWVEKLGWFRGPLGEMRARIRHGPPAR